MENTERLEKYPLSGRLIPEMNNENCRELIYGSYRIMYRLMDKKVIRITGVVHSARDWKSKQNI
jgi:plasmid stabilization system protein ParE